jgi:hypothetical protein
MSGIETGSARRRFRDRSVPPPPAFDPATLPDNAVLTAKELAGWLRFSVCTLEDWRLHHRQRGPDWVIVAGKPRYRMGEIRAWLLSDRPARTGSSVSKEAVDKK